MKSRFGRYHRLAKSGLGWCTEIPTDWKVRRLRHVALFNPSKSEARSLSSDALVNFIPMDSIGERGGLNLDTLKPLSACLDGYTYFRDGDVLIAKITPCFENRKGAIADGLENGTGFGTTELHVLRAAPETETRFLFYVTQSDHFRRIATADMYGAGGQKRVSENFIRDFKHPFPSFADQGRIADYLDRESTRIESLVAKRTHLIALIQEKKIALIRGAITKGLDPTASTRSSGIDWLGEIPAHWNVKPLKRVTRIIGGGTPAKENRSYWDGDILWVSPKDMKVSVITDTEDKISLEAVAESSTQIVPSESVLLVVRSGILAHTIPVAIASREVALNQDIKAFVPTSELSPRYLQYMIAGLQKELLFAWKKEGATVESLEMDFVRNSPTLLPPLSEQLEIVDFLDLKVFELERLISKVGEAIVRLQELRDAVISAAVTGQIDVRAA